MVPTDGRGRVKGERPALDSVLAWAAGELAILAKEIPELDQNGYLVYSSPFGQCKLTSKETEIYESFPEFFVMEDASDVDRILRGKAALGRERFTILNQIKEHQKSKEYQRFSRKRLELERQRDQIAMDGAVDVAEIEKELEALAKSPENRKMVEFQQGLQTVELEKEQLSAQLSLILKRSEVSSDVAIEFRFAALAYQMIDRLKAHPRVRQPAFMMGRAYIRVILIAMEDAHKMCR